MALETPFPRKKIESKGVWARAPFSSCGWSLSRSQYHLLPARLAVPFPQSLLFPKGHGGGISQGPCDSSGSWQSVEPPEVSVLAGSCLSRTNVRDFLLLPVVLQVTDYRVDYVMAGC